MKFTPAAARLAAVSLSLAALAGCGLDDRSARKAVATLLGVGPRSSESTSPAIEPASEKSPWSGATSEPASPGSAPDTDPFSGPNPFADLPAPPPPATNPFAAPPASKAAPAPTPKPAPVPAPAKKAPPAPTPTLPLTPTAPKALPPATKPEAPKPTPPKPVTELELPGSDPIPFAAVRGLIGKKVWSTTSRQLQTRGDDVFVYAGQALTLVKAEPFGDGFNYVTVKTAEGKTGEVQLIYLSRAALQVDLTACGTHEELLAAAFREGLHAAIAQYRLRSRHHFSGPDDGADYHLRLSLEPAVEAMEQLLHGLVYGTTSGTDDVMRNGRTRWVAVADDERLLEIWAHGLDDQAARRRLAAYEGVIDDFEAVDDAGFEIAQLEEEKKEKSWRRDLEGLPARKVAALDQKELAERDERIAELRERMTTRLAQITVEATKLLAGPPD